MSISKEISLPLFLKPYFWSYDFFSLSGSKHIDIIITTLLTLGDKKAVNWLFSVYSEEEIKKRVVSPIPGAFYNNKKSQAFWSLFFDVSPMPFQAQRNIP